MVTPLVYFETRFAQNPSPYVQAEDAHRPVFGLNPQATLLAHEVQDRGLILLIRRVRIIHVLDEDDIHAVPRGRRGCGLVLLKRLQRYIRRDDKDAARVQVGMRSAQRRREVGPAVHMRDRVIHENGVERPAEPAGPHIAFDKRTAGIQLLRLGEHGGTQIKAGDLKLPLQVQDVLPASATDVQQRNCFARGVLANQSGNVLAVVRVFSSRIAPHRPQPCQVGIKMAGVLHGSFLARQAAEAPVIGHASGGTCSHLY